MAAAGWEDAAIAEAGWAAAMEEAVTAAAGWEEATMAEAG